MRAQRLRTSSLGGNAFLTICAALPSGAGGSGKAKDSGQNASKGSRVKRSPMAGDLLSPCASAISIIPYLNGTRAMEKLFGLCAALPKLHK